MPSWVKMTPNCGLIAWGDGGKAEWLVRKGQDARYDDGSIHLAGVIYVYWARVNPEEGVYDWDHIDSRLEKLDKLGLGFTIWPACYGVRDVHGNRMIPRWVVEKPGFTVMSNGVIPAWEPGHPYQTWLRAFLLELGRRYRDRPRLLAVEMRGLDKDWGEFWLNGGRSAFQEAERKHGLTPPVESLRVVQHVERQRFKEWCVRFIDDWCEAFAGREGKLAWMRAGRDFEGGPNYLSPSDSYAAAYTQACADITSHLREKGCGDRTGGTEGWMLRTLDSRLYGQIVTSDGYLEMDESFAPATDGRAWYTENELVSGQSKLLWPDSYADQAWIIMNLRALQMRYRWVWIPPSFYDDYDRRKPGFNRWFELLLGKTAATSPDAWSWLREGDVLGTRIRNFERWLLQRDVVPDGQTTATEHLDTRNWGLYFKWFFGGNAEYHARRTDVAKGQDKIYFRTHREFLAGGPHRLLVKVTYRDGPAATWRLEYTRTRGPAQSDSVTTGNSGTWKTVTFSVPDMHLKGAFSGGMDFRIANLGPKNLTVRFLRIVKPEAPTEKAISGA